MRPGIWLVAVALASASCGGGPSGGSPDDPDSTVHKSPVIEIADGPCAPTVSSGASVREMVHDGETRSYMVAMSDITDGRRLPLVIDMHGAGGTNTAQEAVTGFGRLALETGEWITVTPQALGTIAAWSVPGTVPGDDIGFLEDVVVEMVDNACVDPDRVYAVGFSSGAAMAAYLGCESTLFDGVVPVAGVNLVRRCEDSPPMSLVTFHGLADRAVPLTGLEGWDTSLFDDPQRFYRGDLRSTVESWARRNRCRDEPAETQLSAITTVYEWQGCGDDTIVVMYLTSGMDHVYPTPSSGLDATAEIRTRFLG